MRGGKTESIGLDSIQLPTTNYRLQTGYSEFDRTIGGGFVPGQVVLLAGDPGIGKSTLLLQVAEAIVESRSKNQELRVSGALIRNSKPLILYVAGEESPLQIKQRAERLGINGAGIEVASITDVDEIVGLVNSKFETLNSKQIQNPNSKQIPNSLGQTVDDRRSFVAGQTSRSSGGRLAEPRFSLVIIDSVQTLTVSDVASSAGSVAQVKICAQRLTQAAKELNLPVVLIGHVNKEGDIAGPKVLEHVVDTVLYLEGERALPFRILRAVKNRFGDPTEVGVWQMGERGFKQVTDPALTFLSEKGSGPGTAITAVMEGSRPMLVEVQALCVKTSFGYPRRTSIGFDLNRLFFLIAVLEKTLKLSLREMDIYVNVTAGVRVSDSSADLAVAVAIVGSVKSLALSKKTVVFGEVGLTGEIRSVSLSERRIKEAEKFGFKNVVCPERVSTLKEAVAGALS